MCEWKNSRPGAYEVEHFEQEFRRKLVDGPLDGLALVRIHGFCRFGYRMGHRGLYVPGLTTGRHVVNDLKLRPARTMLTFSMGSFSTIPPLAILRWKLSCVTPTARSRSIVGDCIGPLE